jgi:N-acetylglutamate synthase-like GNAT family acetyltransferase
MEAHRSAVREKAASFYGSDVLDAWSPLEIWDSRIKRMEQDISAGREVFVVAEDAAGGVIGFGAMAPDLGELRAVYVAAGHGGQGVGGAILHHIEEAARASGIGGLRLDASLNAVSFYAAHGFVEEGEGEHVFRSGARMACVHMHKALGRPPRSP